ncbi:MAG: hypothetical protein NUV83_00830 [Candidatus Wolfebacteria bacterium]|nr:hypothetical protein [Candidatus Wolfebacteria bacterium]
MRSFLLSTGLLVGSIVGAGIFSLPYVFLKSGFLAGIIYLSVLGVCTFLIHLMYADIIVRTSETHHRFPGYAKIYLGEKSGQLAGIIVFLANFLTLTVYLILSISFFNLISPQFPLYYKFLIFWLLGSLTIFLKIEKAAFFEILTTSLTLAVIFAVFLAGYFYGLPAVNSPSIALNDLALPFSPTLFSLLGLGAIPALLVYFREKKLPFNKIKRVLLVSTLVVIIAYLLFILGISRLSGTVSEDAVSGLIGNISPAILFFLGIFGVVSLLDSYMSVAFDVEKTMHYEWRLPKWLSKSFVVFLPPALYFLGFQNFLASIGVVGGILFSLWGIMTILVWKKASANSSPNQIVSKIPDTVIYFLLTVFTAGIVYEIIYALA